jgi:hypothetical protein
MAKKGRALIATIMAVMLMTTGQLATVACAPPVIFSYSWTLHPNLPISSYCAGNLGVILPSFARSYLVVAYRYLSGKPLQSDEQLIVKEFVEARLSSEYTDACNGDAKSWLAARSAVPGAAKLASIESMRAVSDEMSWSVYCNCQKSGFDNAAATLQKRIAEYGNSSPWIADWIAAQDKVFANCSGGKDSQPQIPESMPAQAPKLLQQDRAYQIAAAHFYAQQFKEAQNDFDQIAADTTSPWSGLARYLTVRAQIRQATVIGKEGFDADLLKLADENISKLLQQQHMSAYAGPLKALQSYVRTRISPESRLHELGGSLCNHITTSDFDDYIHTFDNLHGANADQSGIDGDYPGSSGADDLTDWITTYQSSGPKSLAHALERWQQVKSQPWLLCVLSKITAQSADANSILLAAGKLGSDTPGYVSSAFLESALLMQAGKLEQASALIDSVLASNKLDPSSKNMYGLLRIQLAETLERFLAEAIAKPLGEWGGGQDEVSWNDSPLSPWLLPSAQRLLDRQMPLNMLRKAAISPAMSANLRNQLAQCVWVRAVLLDDDLTAQQLANVLKMNSKKLAPYYRAFLAAKTPAARKFAAAFLMLHEDDADPTVGSMHEVGEHWWWSNMLPQYSTDEEIRLAKFTNLVRPRFFSVVQSQQGQAELERLKKIAPPGTYLPKIVVGWAQTNPGDPRVPEALHLAVRCTRYAARADKNINYSQEAFKLLHTKYPNSHWSEQTKYWF